jgi:hypothetical protein
MFPLPGLGRSSERKRKTDVESWQLFNERAFLARRGVTPVIFAGENPEEIMAEFADELDSC